MENKKKIGDTLKESYELMHLNDQNMNGNIFGGFIMREALEIGWLAAFSHAKVKFKFFCIIVKNGQI